MKLIFHILGENGTKFHDISHRLIGCDIDTDDLVPTKNSSRYVADTAEPK